MCGEEGRVYGGEGGRACGNEGGRKLRKRGEQSSLNLEGQSLWE